MTRSSLLVCMLWLSSCSLDPLCDPGQRYELGSCLPQTMPATGAGKGGDRGTGEDSGTQTPKDAAVDCKPGPGNYAGFGQSCKSDADCTSCVAPTCATSPINLCSRIECQDDPSACPPGWSCTDISAFSMNPSVTHICLKQ